MAFSPQSKSALKLKQQQETKSPLDPSRIPNLVKGPKVPSASSATVGRFKGLMKKLGKS